MKNSDMLQLAMEKQAMALLRATAAGPGMSKMLKVRRQVPVIKTWQSEIKPPEFADKRLASSLGYFEYTPGPGNMSGKIVLNTPDRGTLRHELTHAYQALLDNPKNPLWTAASKALRNGVEDSFPAELHARLSQYKSWLRGGSDLLRDAGGYDGPVFKALFEVNVMRKALGDAGKRLANGWTDARRWLANKPPLGSWGEL